MRLCGIAIASLALTLFSSLTRAQYQPPSEKLLITTASASTWAQGRGTVIQLQGPLTLELDHAKLRAKQAVIWLAPDSKEAPDQQRAQIALICDAEVEQADSLRSGQRLIVSTRVRGDIRMVARDRHNQDTSGSALYRAAIALLQDAATTRATNAPDAPASQPAAAPATAPTSAPTTTESPTAAPPPAPPGAPVIIQNPGDLQTITTEEGKVAVAITGGVTLFQRRPNGDIIELQAQQAVLYTSLKDLKDLVKPAQRQSLETAIEAAYLEGDVRIVFTPASGNGEQRLRAKRVYYEFGADRAVLTDAVVHTIEPSKQIPVIMRAKLVRQLSQGEYEARGVALTTSAFALPSYSINAQKIYVRQVQTGDPVLGDRVAFRAINARLQIFGVPVFYLPYISGSMTDRASALRGIGITHSTGFGDGFQTTWGFFETLGLDPPRDLDVSYRLDYYSDRGPAGGVAAAYGGAIVSETDREPWNFQGELKSYFVYDKGFDTFGREPTRVGFAPELRGRALWEHQHFFPNDWQVQLRAGYVTDPTFREEWFEREFDEDLPLDVSGYIKRQRDTEAFTLLANVQPNNAITTADQMQEQFEVEHLPELGYHRIGDGIADDKLTFFSDDGLSVLHFRGSSASLAEQGFGPTLSPGIPAEGQTGITKDPTVRGDFRQEIDYPFSAGPFRMVPYVVGRYTGYSDSPAGDPRQRLFAGVGTRLTTSFWKTDDTARSGLFDIHRVRHVIEPEVNLFAGAQTIDRNDVFNYEEQTDAINDVAAAQLAFRQRWQTKRGGPGKWRSVDFLTFNVEGNFFANQPSTAQRQPLAFRGLYFPSLPEASVARNAINTDASWRVSDNTVLLADAQYNLDKTNLATAAVGVLVRRDDRISYYVGTRYIEELNSNIATVFLNYEISKKYSVEFSQNYDFGLGQNVSSNLAFVRHFDRFFAIFRVYHNSTNDESGFGINIFPTGLGYGLNSDQLQSAFRQQ